MRLTALIEEEKTMILSKPLGVAFVTLGWFCCNYFIITRYIFLLNFVLNFIYK